MNRFFIPSILVIVCLALYSCKKSGSSPQVPVITGINMTDIYASPIGTVGNPNVLTASNGNTMSCYPNPYANDLTVRLVVQQAGVLTLWMVAAIYNNPPDSAKIENQYLYTHQSNPPLSTTKQINAGTNGFIFNTDSLPNGFYKLYAIVNADTLYDNIWIKR
jgi:hypothetical protein